MAYIAAHPSQIKITKLFVKKTNDKVITVTKIFNKNLTGETKIVELRKYLIETEGDVFEEAGFIYAGKQISEQDNQKMLADFGVKNNGVLSVVFRVHGGSAVAVEGKVNVALKANLKDEDNGDGPRRIASNIDAKTIPIGVSLNRSKCEFLLELPDEGFSNAKMSCAHVVSAEGMFDYLNSSLKRSNEYEVKCPTSGCNTVWDIDACLWVARVSESEEKEFLEKLNDNAVKHPTSKIKECPSCGAYVQRPKELIQNRVRCPLCKSKDWCWWCLQEWIGSGDQICNREDCTHNAQQASLLINCDKKEISSIKNVPVLRLCPSCGAMVEWLGACKHVTCMHCKFDFCMSCLKNWKALGGNNHIQDVSNDKCPLQPIQSI